MADDTEIRRINWTEVFSFTQIFKSFRLAMHFSKLALAMSAIILVFVLGTVMDTLTFGSSQYVAPGEIAAYTDAGGGARFDLWKTSWEKARPFAAAELVASTRAERFDLSNFQRAFVTNRYLSEVFSERLTEENKKENTSDRYKSVSDILKGTDGKAPSWTELMDKAQAELNAEVAKLEVVLKDIDKAAKDKIKKALPEGEQGKAMEDLDTSMGVLRTGIARTKLAFGEQKASIATKGIFCAFKSYELGCLGQGKVVAMLMGFGWLLSEHWIYGPIFVLLSLGIWALFGGAIARIAALHAAREEKMSASQALRFGFEKFLSFLTAPLLPLLLVVVLGVLILVGGALLSIPGVHILFALLFFLVIIASLAIAFLLIGWFFGGPLMYPTIAVEGSDSFDAMSRSFSYVLNRPWRSILYGLVAWIYGALTYLFVRFFAYLALSAGHAFAKAGAWRGGGALSPTADQVDLLWGAPTFNNLLGTFHWEAMSFAEKISAGIIWVYVFLVAALVGSYLISYFISASTTIYLLLRRHVDATDVDDVYVEEPEEELSSSEAPQATETVAPGAGSAPAGPADAAQPPTPGTTPPA